MTMSGSARSLRVSRRAANRPLKSGTDVSGRSVVMFHSDDDVPSLAPGIDVSVSLGHLRERVTPIDDRLELSRLRQLREETQVLWAHGGWPGDDFPAARQRHPWR